MTASPLPRNLGGLLVAVNLMVYSDDVNYRWQ